MSRMPKLSMEINENMEMLNETEYLDKPQKPSSIPKEKPPKKKRVMSEAQLENLAKAREKSALNRRLKKEKKVADKVALKEEKKKTKIKKAYLPPIEEEEEEDYGNEGSDMEVELTETNNGGGAVDYEYIMSNVYGMIKEDEVNRVREEQERQEAEKDYNERKDSYDNKIRQEERDRLMGIVEEKRKKKVRETPLKPQGTDWDSCFQPRGRGGDQFF